MDVVMLSQERIRRDFALRTYRRTEMEEWTPEKQYRELQHEMRFNGLRDGPLVFIWFDATKPAAA
jgi:hypothetical protein